MTARAMILGGLGLAAGLLAVAPGIAQPDALAMLDRLAPGRWEVRVRDTDGASNGICLRDGRELIQLRHPGGACERYVIDDAANDVTVQYTCRGRGYGRTHIRREADGLAQIESQGIAGGMPFSFVAEARRVGACGGA